MDSRPASARDQGRLGRGRFKEGNVQEGHREEGHLEAKRRQTREGRGRLSFVKAAGLLLALGLGGCATTSGDLRGTKPGEVPNPQASLIDFGWPTQVPVVIDYFGWRSKKRVHEGVDLAARTGTPILAAEKGRVLYVGSSLKGYGLMVVIDHGDDWSSSYAHLSRAAVRRGDWVEKGQQIALSGRSGRVTGPHLHFEIRKGADPLDPTLFLPQD